MRIVVHCSLLFALAWTPTRAQESGRLSGSVVDPSRSPVASAKITLRITGSPAAAGSTLTTTEGFFTFTALRPGVYHLDIDVPGFRKLTLSSVKVDPARETSLPPQQLELGAVTEVVEVTAAPPNVQTTNAEISVTVTNEQLRMLPVFERSPMNLLYTQVGVQQNANTATVINGQRTSYANVTLDGINIQDNAVRSNSLDFIPNRPFTDQVGEMTVITSNAGAMFGNGSSQVIFTTPSGGNQFRGTLYWSNRNSALAANGWFSNQDGIKRPQQSQNQGGASVGGRIVRDKLFFYTNYEAYRFKRQSVANRTILTATARQGIFRYLAGGEVREANLLQIRQASVDPYVRQLLDLVPGPERINNFRAGDSREGLLLNTAGYSFNIRNNVTRDNSLLKFDYIPSASHTVAGSWAFNRDFTDRPDNSNDYSAVPKVVNDNTTNLISLAWRWSATPRLTNELRGGFNRSPGNFLTSEKFPGFLVEGLLFSNPVNGSYEETRQTNTYNYQNNASYSSGRHFLRFGFQAQNIRLGARAFADTLPTYTVGIGTGNPGFVNQDLPGIGNTDLARANGLYSNLAGFVRTYSQRFNVANRTSGFVSGTPFTTNQTLDNYAFYFQDTWKLRRGLTLTLGLRHDWWSPVDEANSLLLQPVTQKDNFLSSLLSDFSLDFAGKSAGRPLYRNDRNNWAPHVALAWDVFGDGKTAVRTGYGVYYANDDFMTAMYNNLVSNPGLSTTAFRDGLSGRLSTPPGIPTPAFAIPRKASQNIEDNPAAFYGATDPNLHTPYIQQWTFGIQHEIRGNALEVRYVGNHAVDGWRVIDYNQVIIRENGFLDDFKRARRNGFLAMQGTGRFDPNFSASIPGSERLTVFPRLAGGGLLTNPTIISQIQQGQAGNLAYLYQSNGLEGAVDFYRNPLARGLNTMTNLSHSNYNALQAELRRRMRTGLNLQASYSYAKGLSDAEGTSQSRFEPYLDFGNRAIERARTPFDITHDIKVNFLYELPFGAGRPIPAAKLGRLASGWALSTFSSYRSGNPFSMLSARGTLNRAGARSAGNTALTSLNKQQIDDLFSVRVTGAGPFFMAASTIGSDGRGVSQDGLAAFNGQAFSHPGPGEVGNLQRRMFSGPWVFDWDAAIQKTTVLRETHSLVFRMEVFSVPNNQAWFFGDELLDSSSFGRITSTATSRRSIQFALQYRF